MIPILFCLTVTLFSLGEFPLRSLFSASSWPTSPDPKTSVSPKLSLARRPAPIDPRQLAGHEVMGYDQSLAASPGAKWLDAHGAQVSVELRCREMTDMLAAATAGLGLAVLPCMLGKTEPPLKGITDQILVSLKLSLVYRREMLKVAPVRR